MFLPQMSLPRAARERSSQIRTVTNVTHNVVRSVESSSADSYFSPRNPTFHCRSHKTNRHSAILRTCVSSTQHLL